jgi:3-methyl-2-oxobutanoate hydroxymethyltransferase
MPFMSFQVSSEEAIRTAGRFVKEGGMEAVKIEGGKEVSKIVESISRVGIPVLGHIGVTPQTATLRGGYRIQGRNLDSSDKLVDDAKSLEEAGAFGVVLEMVTEEVAKIITETVSIPTVGIGSGRFCDGQVLVLHDIIGLYPSFTPKFAKQYVHVAGMIKQALQNFATDVRNGVFPEQKHVFRMEEDQRAKLDSKRKI